MRFSVFVPPQAETRRVPVLYWLSGLTCTEENFTIKAGVQRYAAEHGILIVAPDTSPRGAGVATSNSWDLGLGAGFYVNATEMPWKLHYRMYDYVTKELRKLVEEKFPVMTDRQGIFGHSMGGHGALVIALKEPERYRSVSAFAPIVAPCQVPWGQKAFRAYLGDDLNSWKQYDASELVRRSPRKDMILIDQGSDDKFLEEGLRPDIFEAACKEAGQPLELRIQKGYDHSYYFISSFIGEHIAFHSKLLNA
jgi:S-formylglutathione hydrolase